jgi:hypothetical protein
MYQVPSVRARGQERLPSLQCVGEILCEILLGLVGVARIERHDGGELKVSGTQKGNRETAHLALVLYTIQTARTKDRKRQLVKGSNLDLYAWAYQPRPRA